MQTSEDLQLQLILNTDLISAFYPLLQRGVWLPVTTGSSVMKLLNNQLGIAETYLTDRITTLFLNGKAIDDVTSSFVSNESTLALSSAMPGLVGSTMRRGGHLAAMRGEITYQQTRDINIGAGKIKVKLFNMLMKEVGPLLLERGIFLSGTELMTLLEEGSSSFKDGCLSAVLNNQTFSCAELRKKLQINLESQQTVLLKITWND